MQREKQQIEEELYRRLEILKHEQEDRERSSRVILYQETELDAKMQQEYLQLEQMREKCPPSDCKLLQAIDEGLDALTAVRKHRLEFLERLQNEVKKESGQNASETDEINYLLRQLEEERKKENIS